MPHICLYLHLHQPLRLPEFSVEDLGMNTSYFFPKKDDNKEIFLKVTEKSYRPMLKLLLRLLKTNDSFRVAFSITGLWVEQAERYAPDLLPLLKEILQ